MMISFVNVWFWSLPASQKLSRQCQSFYMAISCLSKVQTLSSAQTQIPARKLQSCLEAVMSKSPWQLLLQIMSLRSLSPSAFVHVTFKCNIFLSQCSGHQCADAKDRRGITWPFAAHRMQEKSKVRRCVCGLWVAWGVVLMALWSRLCERSLCHSFIPFKCNSMRFGTVVVLFRLIQHHWWAVKNEKNRLKKRMKIPPSFNHPHVISNLYRCRSFMEQKRCFDKNPPSY